MTAVSRSFHLPIRILSLCRDLLPGFSHVFRTDGPNRSYFLMLMTLKIPPSPALEQWSKCTFQQPVYKPLLAGGSACKSGSGHVLSISSSTFNYWFQKLLVSAVLEAMIGNTFVLGWCFPMCFPSLNEVSSASMSISFCGFVCHGKSPGR